MSVLEELEGTIQTAVERFGPAVIGLGQGWGRGSGFVIDSNRILTNAHNLRGDEVTVTFHDGRREAGRVLASDADVEGIAPNVLTQRLRQLERNALVVARPYSERPPRFVYELSSAGQELAGALRLIAGWGARHGDSVTAPRHVVCDTPMEARWWCPTCERAVEDDEDELEYA